jgi:hypothetical protein
MKVQHNYCHHPTGNDDPQCKRAAAIRVRPSGLWGGGEFVDIYEIVRTTFNWQNEKASHWTAFTPAGHRYRFLFR